MIEKQPEPWLRGTLTELPPILRAVLHALELAGEDVESLQTLQTYLSEVQQTTLALKAAVPDAEKKPGGFKELQIGVRESIRRVDDLILTLPTDKRPFFRDVRTDLVTVQNELIDALFPRQPSVHSKKASP